MGASKEKLAARAAEFADGRSHPRNSPRNELLRRDRMTFWIAVGRPPRSDAELVNWASRRSAAAVKLQSHGRKLISRAKVRAAADEAAKQRAAAARAERDRLARERENKRARCFHDWERGKDTLSLRRRNRRETDIARWEDALLEKRRHNEARHALLLADLDQRQTAQLRAARGHAREARQKKPTQADAAKQQKQVARVTRVVKKQLRASASAKLPDVRGRDVRELLRPLSSHLPPI
ncbi:hypothetical protein M885DRAFT_520199 [Pelagophyceae sp. CCMP2097]|nr:hypothetical protein M885DRAFT_520199 [Pelagophyceae sp. CCMP2097]